MRSSRYVAGWSAPSAVGLAPTFGPVGGRTSTSGAFEGPRAAFTTMQAWAPSIVVNKLVIVKAIAKLIMRLRTVAPIIRAKSRTIEWRLSACCLNSCDADHKKYDLETRNEGAHSPPAPPRSFQAPLPISSI